MPIPTDAARETSEYGFRDFWFQELRFAHTGISNTLAGGLSGTNLLVHSDGGPEEDEEGGSQKGETQE